MHMHIYLLLFYDNSIIIAVIAIIQKHFTELMEEHARARALPRARHRLIFARVCECGRGLKKKRKKRKRSDFRLARVRTPFPDRFIAHAQ